MKITQVETIPLQVPLDRPISFATREVREREFTIVQIFTDEEISGFGCIPIGDPLSVKAVVDHKLKNLIVGEDPLCYERIWKKMYDEMYRDRKGAAIRAMSAVDIALWDIKGKALEMPLYKMLGGYRDKVPCYASGGYYHEGKGIEGLKQEMNNYMDKGYTAVKIKIGALSVRDDLERVKAARETIGPEVDLLIDANNAYDTPTAIKVGRELEKFDVYFFEEPVKPDNLEGSRIVAEALDVPVASGELEYTVYGFRDLIQEGGIDIIQPDATVLGGITEWIKVASLAKAHYIPISPHWEQEVHMHLVGAFPNTLWVEFFEREIGVRVEDKLYQTFPHPVDGYLNLPDKPGLGRELDRESIDEYRVES